jgi:hypothetical protein
MKITIFESATLKEKYFETFCFEGLFRSATEAHIELMTKELGLVKIPYTDMHKIETSNVINLIKILSNMQNLNILVQIEILTNEIPHT